jgi:hypothetical protein
MRIEARAYVGAVRKTHKQGRSFGVLGFAQDRDGTVWAGVSSGHVKLRLRQLARQYGKGLEERVSTLGKVLNVVGTAKDLHAV